ncbi:hypothetical protein HY310_02650, partial [Candidatus Microgenomates bacterium]|nr:hypothetical protein [Candidatus Microgenomates bacterium]
LDTKIANLVKAQDSYTQALPYIPLLNQALPSNPNPQTVINDIHKVASGSAVNLVAFQVQAVPLSKDLPVESTAIGVPGLQFAVSISGKQADLRKFMGDLERQLRYIRVSKFSISRDDKTSDFSADVLYLAYYYGDMNK